MPSSQMMSTNNLTFEILLQHICLALLYVQFPSQRNQRECNTLITSSRMCLGTFVAPWWVRAKRHTLRLQDLSVTLLQINNKMVMKTRKKESLIKNQ